MIRSFFPRLALILPALGGLCAAGDIPNPEFPYWKEHTAGAEVTFVTSTFSEDPEAKPAKKGKAAEPKLVNKKTVTSTITKVAADGVTTQRKTVISAPTRKDVSVDEEFTHASTWDERYKVEYKDLGTESVIVAAGTFKCVKMQRVDKKEFDGEVYENVVTRWWSKDVPGGLVKMTVTGDGVSISGEVTKFKKGK